MTAIISTTHDDQYLFYLPITAWAWNKLGVNVVCFVPSRDIENLGRLGFIMSALWSMDFIKLQLVTYKCSADKESTYAQCSRLYAAATPLFEDDEVLITGDIDMAVFDKERIWQLNDGRIHIVGADLVPESQYPMCYIAMPAEKWREVMYITLGQSHQDKLDQLLGRLECEHFRGNYWGKDQETAYNHLFMYELVKHNRAKPGTQFASNRADRDGWPEVIEQFIMDAHLPRPGYTEENFKKIYQLFQTMYPHDDIRWMKEYRDAYVKLI